MSYENVPKNLPENVVLTRQGTPEYTKLDSEPFPVPTADPKEVGAILLVTDTGVEYKWTGTNWVALSTAVPKNWELELAAGRIPGKSDVHLFGRNPDIAMASGFEDIWEGGDLYTGFNATAAEPMSIVSTDAADTNSSGTGAWLILIAGLDAAYNEITEVVALNGLTPVLTVNNYLRCNSVIVISAGTAAQNVGNIIGTQSVTIANTLFTINSGINRTLMAIYTVPANKVAYVTSGFITAANKQSASCEVQAKSRRVGSVFQIAEWFAVNTSGSSYVYREFKIPLLPVPAGTDIKICADTDTNGVAVAAGLEIILEDV